jgi:hypothetical protein
MLVFNWSIFFFNYNSFKVDTNYGVKCPLKAGIYEKLDTKHRNTHHGTQTQQTQQQQPCKYLTQTQTLQIGCQNEQQYSLRTRLCYPNHQYKHDVSVSTMSTNSDENASASQSKLLTTAFTQLESEINLVCLAHWRHDGNQIIVSRTMSNEILCSVYNEFYFILFF